MTCFVFAPEAAVSKIRIDFQNCHIWAWNLAIGKLLKDAHILFLPQVVKIEVMFDVRTSIFEKRADVPYLVMKSGIGRWVPKLHTYSLSTSELQRSKLIFDLRAAAFEILADFQTFYIWAWNLEFEDRSTGNRFREQLSAPISLINYVNQCR